MRRLGIFAFVLALVAGAALGAVPAPRTIARQDPAPVTIQEVSFAQAEAALAAAVAEAQARDLEMVVAVVDTGANLKAFVRMDGALLGSVDVAIAKARTAVLVQAPSGALGPLVQPGQPLYGLEVTNGGLVTFPGGIPLFDADGAVIGAIGVSGGSVEEDEAVAKAGAAALGGPNATPTP